MKRSLRLAHPRSLFLIVLVLLGGAVDGPPSSAQSTVTDKPFPFEDYLDVKDNDASIRKAKEGLLQRFPVGSPVSAVTRSLQVQTQGRLGECEQRRANVFCRYQHTIIQVAGQPAPQQKIADWWVTVRYTGTPRTITEFQVQLSLR
jgi:hypothetical protein